MMAASSAMQLPRVVAAVVTSPTNCDLEPIEAETPRLLLSESTRSAHRLHMQDRVFLP